MVHDFWNRLYVPWIGPCEIFDGNGIIIDDSRNTQNQSDLDPYYGRTLIENNLVYKNGGSGIHTYLSDYVDIINNTAYQNQQTPTLNEGEIFANESGNIRIENNIMVASIGKKITMNYKNENCIYRNNLYFGGTDPKPFGEASIIADPLFVNLSADTTQLDFRLKAGSPAINAANAELISTTDFTRLKRPQGAQADIGAYEMPTPESLSEPFRRLNNNQSQNSTSPIRVNALGQSSHFQSYYNFRSNLRKYIVEAVKEQVAKE